VRFFPIALVACLACSCGGQASLEGGVYHDPEARYRVGNLGTGWSELGGVASQNDIAYFQEALGAIVQVNASCDPELDIPLVALTNHLLIGFTERDIKEQTLVPLDAREAMRTHVHAKLDGVPRELLFYVLKKDGCVYDFALIAPPGDPFSRASVSFEAFVRRFHAQGGPAAR